MVQRLLVWCALALALGASTACAAGPARECAAQLVVLGVGQDGGAPQLGRNADPAWANPDLHMSATALGVRDSESGQRWLFEATPDLREQMHRFDAVAPGRDGDPLGLSGVFLTHAHIGHYAGLMFVGHESAGAQGLNVYAMPRMAEYLTANGPWSQLVRYNNIVLKPLADRAAVEVSPRLRVTPLLVPHRQEFSEVVGYRLEGPSRRVLFIPDIDSWEQWDSAGVRIEDQIASVDIAFLDATFYANGEIPGRDMSGFPHPFITHSMERFAALPAQERAKVWFIHMNHSNRVRFPGSAERAAVESAGFHVAAEGDQFCL